MPVELPVSQAPETPPRPPRAIVWLCLFVVSVLVGVVATLLTWPKTESTGAPWFWVQLLVLPALAWGIVFGLRLHYFDDESDRLRAEDETLQADRARAIQFASEPLAVLGHAYLCALGSAGVAGKIAENETALCAQTPHSGGEAVRHTALALEEDIEAPGRYRACFKALLEGISEALTAIPSNEPLAVRLQLPRGVSQPDLLETWQVLWRDSKLRPVRATLLSPEQGMMALDEWLDIKGGPALEKFTLFVSVQLHEMPPDDSAEAAVALLLGWAPLAERRGVAVQAMLHRPIEADVANLNQTISMALLWGKATAAETKDLWQAALDPHDKPAFLQTFFDCSLGVSQTDELRGIHDIDKTLGSPDSAAGWLAAALAVEHVTQRGAPQLIAWREGSLRLAIAQPTTQANKKKSDA